MQVSNNTGSSRVVPVVDFRYSYAVKVVNDELGYQKLIRSNNKYDLESKVTTLLYSLEEKVDKKREREVIKKSKSDLAQYKDKKIQLASTLSEEAIKAIEDIENLLAKTLLVDDKLDWNSLCNHTPFNKQKPKAENKIEYPEKPERVDPEFRVNPGLLDRMFGNVKKMEEEANERYLIALEKWKQDVGNIDSTNVKNEKMYENKIKKWQEEEADYYSKQEKENNDVLKRKEKYLKGEKDAIIDYVREVLNRSQYPENFPKNYDIYFNSDNKMIGIDYQLPCPTDMPSLKEVNYIASKDEFKEVYLSESVKKKMYDESIYKICLRTIHEIYESDVIGAIETVAFNGTVEYADPATGNETLSCLISIVVTKNEFENINLEKVSPKECFKKLKGVGSSSLFGLTPVQPVVVFDKNDKRFINPDNIIQYVESATNLATMEWQDFEHLIREVFEKEFSSSGGEVKITRGSRDGGVDAVAFDPDPIRGGKIVIQAKRYNNTVGVSAVRDLYGTLINEGASKGILITTSDYGPDAYEFSKGKPLTLLNGANLLYLLEKHGHTARIDLKEMKTNQ